MSWAEDIGYDAYDPYEEEDEYICDLIKERIWLSRAKEIPIEEMETSHIKNAIEWIEKHYTAEDRIYEFKEILTEEYINRLKED